MPSAAPTGRADSASLLCTKCHGPLSAAEESPSSEEGYKKTAESTLSLLTVCLKQRRKSEGPLCPRERYAMAAGHLVKLMGRASSNK